MNHWPFVAGAYALTVLPTLALVVASYRTMRKAEAAADALKGDR
ncbi:MAG TPA: heme exporter protein CcmD [Allosphingosinicella sp.]